MKKITRPNFAAPRKMAETSYADGRLTLPAMARQARERWPWVVLGLAPLVGGAVGTAWHFLTG